MNTSLSIHQQVTGAVSGLTLAALLIMSIVQEPGHTGEESASAAVPETVPTFSDYPAGRERKAAFFSFLHPIVEAENTRIRDLRDELMALREQRSWSESDRSFLAELGRQHRIRDFDPSDDSHWALLLRRVDVVPVSLALAQAANESAWGTSRFARVANNYFGQWCFKAGCGVVPRQRKTGMTHEVRSFEHPEGSVRAYIRNLNSHPAYRPLRVIRAELRAEEETVSGSELAEGLLKYSERGEDYVDEIKAMIRHNRLHEFDSA